MKMEMTPKRRLLAAINGQEIDHIPFSPFLAYYFDFLPKEVREKGQLEYLKAMGADPLLRGFISAYTIHHQEGTVTEKLQENRRYITTHTPKGDLHSTYTYVPESNTWFLTEYPIKEIDDFQAAMAFYKDIRVVDNRENANHQVNALGEDGLHVALIGVNNKSSYQYMLEHLMGTENLIYLTMDYPDEVRELVDLIASKNRETVEYTASSDIEACLSWEDSSTTNLSPALYNEWIAPEIREWTRLLQDAGKLYIQHACGHIKDLLLPVAGQGVAAIESISPPPTGNVIMTDAAKILPSNVALIGGIDPVHFLNDQLETLLEYVEQLCYSMKGRGFVLANSDSCPPDVQYEKFQRIARLVKDMKL